MTAGSLGQKDTDMAMVLPILHSEFSSFFHHFNHFNIPSELSRPRAILFQPQMVRRGVSEGISGQKPRACPRWGGGQSMAPHSLGHWGQTEHNQGGRPDTMVPRPPGEQLSHPLPSDPGEEWSRNPTL